MRLDDRTADREAHSQALGLCRVEGLKGAVGSCRIDRRIRILHGNRDGILPGFCGLDEQFLRPTLGTTRMHRPTTRPGGRLLLERRTETTSNAALPKASYPFAVRSISRNSARVGLPRSMPCRHPP